MVSTYLSSIFLAAQIAAVQVGAPPFKESILPEVKTSGEDVLGVISNDPLDKVTPQFVVSGISPHDRYLCVEIHSVSGLYQAKFWMKNPNLGSTVMFKLPTPGVTQTKNVAGGLAVWVRPASSEKCSDIGPALQVDQPPVGPLLPAAWGDGAPGRSLMLLINSRRADRVRIQVSGQAAVECRSIKDVLRSDDIAARAYDSACPVAWSGRCPAEISALVFLNDARFVRDPIGVRLRAPC